MNATTVAVDLAKNVFQLAYAVAMEACGTARYWARQIEALGIEVRLLPARYIRAYVKRNKTDAADAAALLEAVRCADIQPESRAEGLSE